MIMNTNDKRMIDKDNVVLLVGSFNNQQILNEIYMAKRGVKIRMLTSSPQNWEVIIREIRRAKKNGKPVFVNFSESILLIACNSEYKKLFTNLLDALAGCPHILFLYQDAFIGKYNIFTKPFYSKYLIYNWSHSMSAVIEDERVIAHEKTIMETYFETVDYYCSEVLSKLTIPLERKIQEDIISNIRNRFNCDIDRNQLVLDINLPKTGFEKVLKSEQYKEALVLSRRLVMLSLATDEKEIKFRLYRLSWMYSDLFDITDDDDLSNYYTGYDDITIDNKKCEIDYDREVERLCLFDIERKNKPDETLFFEYWLKKFIVERNTDIQNAVNDMTIAVEQIKARNLNIVPYLHSIELVSAIRDFFSETESETVYTRYIYKDQLFAFELERFLTLFQDYITKVKGVNIVFEEKRTEIGIVYMLKSTDANVTKYNISDYIQEFAKYLDQCDNNIEFAKSILSNKYLTDKQREELALRFHKEAIRIKNDIIHDAERKMMDLRHFYEDMAIEMAVDKLPTLNNLSTTLSDKPITKLIQIDNKGIVNIQYIYGNATFNENDKQLFSIIEKYADNSQELIDAVKILKDQAIPKETKNESSTKLKKLLAKTASKIGDVGFSLLNKYLELLLFGP